MLSVLQSDRFPSGVQGQKRRLQAHRPTHLKWGDLTFGADYPVRMLGLTLVFSEVRWPALLAVSSKCGLKTSCQL